MRPLISFGIFTVKKTAALIVLTLGLTAGAEASTYSDNLAKCILENTSSADQETMTQWAFVTLGKTAAAKKVQTIPAAKTKEVETKAKNLVTKLALGACSKQFALVMTKEPKTGLQATASYIAADLLKDQFVSSGLNLFPSLKNSQLTNLLNSETMDVMGSLLKNVLKK